MPYVTFAAVRPRRSKLVVARKKPVVHSSLDSDRWIYIDGYIPLSIDQYRWIHSDRTNRHRL